jgi:hypothetical protein
LFLNCYLNFRFFEEQFDDGRVEGWKDEALERLKVGTLERLKVEDRPRTIDGGRCRTEDLFLNCSLNFRFFEEQFGGGRMEEWKDEALEGLNVSTLERWTARMGFMRKIGELISVHE